MKKLTKKVLTALPVFNEAENVMHVLDEVLRYTNEVLVVDDGSNDGSAELLAGRDDIQLITHSANQGYGAALISAFNYAIENGYDSIVTIDCDGQHEPQRIPELAAALHDTDIASGSRYLKEFSGDNPAPGERRNINWTLTKQLNEVLNLGITDAFCGFKSYRVEALAKMTLTEPGYGMPLEVWVLAAALKLKIKEVAVPRIYLDERRSFGGSLDNGAKRLKYYQSVLKRACAAAGLSCGCDGPKEPRSAECCNK